MARLIIPDDFASQLTLLTNIIAKQNSDGDTSPLTLFLNQQSISLTNDAAAGTAAQTHETNRLLLSRQSENYHQLRDNRFNGVWKAVTGSVQFLKSFYKGNTKQLGDWGITITDSGKVDYPPAFANRTLVFNAFMEKNNSYQPGQSPLQVYLTQQAINLERFRDLVHQATENNNSFLEAAKHAEFETSQRNLLWNPVMEHVRAIGNFLMKLNTVNPKALGLWGFMVDDSPQKPKLRTSKLKLGEQITVSPVLVGSTLTNTGKVEIHVYKGKTTTGNPAIVHPNEQMGILKGFSTITVTNPSLLETAVFTVMVSK